MLIYLQKKDTSFFYSELDYDAVTFAIRVFLNKNILSLEEDDE